MDTIISHSPEETHAVGVRLAERVRAGSVVALTGELGAGKTHLVKGIAEGLGVETGITSPTFTLVHEHAGHAEHKGLPLWHVDLYRLETEAEALGIGLEELLGNGEGVVVLEWADKFPALLPPGTLWVRLRCLDETRREIEIMD